MVKKIGFLGRSGTGKTILVSNISAAMAKLGYKVLQIGNDISLSSTELLREEKGIVAVLDMFREKFDICIEDYMVDTPSGVYCLELGSIDPGAGCLSRGLSTVDELIEEQGLLEKYAIDYVIYDIAGDTPCTGYILPFREKRLHQAVLVTNDRFSAVCTMNSLCAALVRPGYEQVPVSMVENMTDPYSTWDLLDAYAERINMTILGRMPYDQQAEKAALRDETVASVDPSSDAAQLFFNMAKTLISLNTDELSCPKPFDSETLLQWQRQWKLKRLASLEKNV